MKKLLNLKGAQELSKNDLKSIQGGGLDCSNQPNYKVCDSMGHVCCGGICCQGNCVNGHCIIG